MTFGITETKERELTLDAKLCCFHCFLRMSLIVVLHLPFCPVLLSLASSMASRSALQSHNNDQWRPVIYDHVPIEASWHFPLSSSSTGQSLVPLNQVKSAPPWLKESRGEDAVALLFFSRRQGRHAVSQHVARIRSFPK